MYRDPDMERRSKIGLFIGALIQRHVLIGTVHQKPLIKIFCNYCQSANPKMKLLLSKVRGSLHMAPADVMLSSKFTML